MNYYLINYFLGPWSSCDYGLRWTFHETSYGLDTCFLHATFDLHSGRYASSTKRGNCSVNRKYFSNLNFFLVNKNLVREKKLNLSKGITKTILMKREN